MGWDLYVPPGRTIATSDGLSIPGTLVFAMRAAFIGGTGVYSR